MADARLPSPGELLPHTGLALVLDELTALEPGKSATGIWTPGSLYYDGHFPGNPRLPGHWIEESAALTAACAVRAEDPNALPLLRESHFLFSRPVVPGDTLELSVSFTGQKEARGLVIAEGMGRISVAGQLVARANLIKAVWEKL